TVSMNGRRIEVMADPLADLVRAGGCEPLIWLTTYASAIPRSQSSARVQLWFGLLQAKGVLGAGARRGGGPAGEPGFLGGASVLGLPSSAVSPRWLTSAACRVAALRAGIERKLERIRPHLVAVNCYYSLQNMALVAACRRLGIPSVDLQHGVQGAFHIAYGPWMQVPSQGWDLLPDRFWCWSEPEVNSIRSWAARAGGHHVPLVGGNPWLDSWRAGDSPLVREMDSRVARLCAQRPGRKRVLVTLQWGMNDQAYLLPLREAIRYGDPDLDWWIRLHPLM